MPRHNAGHFLLTFLCFQYLTLVSLPHHKNVTNDQIVQLDGFLIAYTCQILYILHCIKGY